MIKQYLSIVLIGLLVYSANTSLIFAQTKMADAEKIKAEVLKRGTNDKKRVRVKMLNGSKIKGYISQIGDDSFSLSNSKTKQPTVIAYRDVEKVESGGLAGGVKIGIIAAAAAGATLLVLYIAFENATRNN